VNNQREGTILNKRQRILKGQSKMDNPEKLETLGKQDTRRRQTKQKHNTICVGHHYIVKKSLKIPKR
jgi:hypothetical protein